MYFCLPACTGTSCPRCFVAISIFWSGIFSDPLASLEQATAFHYKQVMVQHVQHRPEHRTGKGVRDHLSCGTGAKVGLRRSFKKYVCITDDLLEEITVLSHYFYRIWPALHCTGLISVQLGWLLCIQWQKSTRRQEEPDSLQLRTVFWELTALFAWKIMLFPLLACVNGVRDFFFFFFKDCFIHLMPSMNSKFHQVVSENQTYWSPIKTEFTCSNQNAFVHGHDFHTRKGVSVFTLVWMIHRWSHTRKVKSLCINLVSSF